MPNYVKGFTVNGEDAKYDYNQLGNKPFGDNTFVDVFPLTEFSTAGSSTGQSDPIYSTQLPVAGDLCVVSFEGTNYEVVAKSSQGGYIYLGEEDEYTNPVFTNYPFLVVIFLRMGGFIIETETAGTYTASISKNDKTRLPMNSMPHELEVINKYELIYSASDLEFQEAGGDPNYYYTRVSGWTPTLQYGAKYRVTIGDYSVELYCHSSGSLGGSSIHGYAVDYPFYIQVYNDVEIQVSEDFYNQYHPTTVSIECIVPNPMEICGNVSVACSDSEGINTISLVEALNKIALAANIDNLTFYINREQADALN